MKPCPDGMKTNLIFDFISGPLKWDTNENLFIIYANILIQYTSTSGKTFAENSEYMNSATTYLSHQYSPRK